MGDRRTHASVTDLDCTCGYLQSAADDPASPIVFDEQTSEYQFTYCEPECDGPSMLVIYHCPFCGGAAPESRRDLLFAAISEEEEQRLAELLAPIETIQKAIDAFGLPQMDDFSPVRKRRRDAPETPPTIERRRQLCFELLSNVADVRITEHSDGHLSWMLFGKYLGGDNRAGPPA